MSTTAAPAAAATALPGGGETESSVQWFGASARLIRGQPDARYGWWQRAEGLCIVKALDPEIAAYNATLLDHERHMLQRLAELDAPSPTLVPIGQSHWLVTRFAGLSLQRLQRSAAATVTADPVAPLMPLELWSAWLHLMPRLDRLARRGVLVLDLYAPNVLLPLTRGTEGQLRLNEPCVVDHAHTLAPGMELRRPVWIDTGMSRIAPELREALDHDVAQLKRRFTELGAELPGYSRLPGDLDRLSRRAWAEYDAPQRLQALLDQGLLDPDRAMQHAMGVALRALPPVPGLTAAAAQRLARGVDRLCAQQPAGRHASLSAAAEELREAIGALPHVSAGRCGRIGAADLAVPRARSEPTAAGPAPRAFAGGAAGMMPKASTSRGARLPRWLLWAAALGGVLGSGLPLP